MHWHDLLLDLLHRYGYAFICIIILLESMGAPLPGESLLIAASIYASTTHRLEIWLVVSAAAVGAIVGDNFGFLIGHYLGAPALVRFGSYVGLNERRVKLGQYLFRRHGAKVVFFGRFIAFLRTFAALLAGANRMHWKDFLVWNALGGVVWVSLYGFGGYLLGDAALRLVGSIGITVGVIALVVVGYAIYFVKRHEKRLMQEAENAIDGV